MFMSLRIVRSLHSYSHMPSLHFFVGIAWLSRQRVSPDCCPLLSSLGRLVPSRGLLSLRLPMAVLRRAPPQAGSSSSFPPLALFTQNNHTYQKSTLTAAKNPNQTLHPTPVFSAILNILFIVPRNRTLVLSKESFIVSVNLEESRISSPIAIVI